MRTPNLNRPLKLETPNKVADGAGGYATTWQPLGVVWANCRARTGRERGISGAPVSTVSYVITVRGAPVTSPARPRPEQRFRDGERVFNIHAVTESDDSAMYLYCYAEEEVVA